MRTLFIAANWKMNPPPDGAFAATSPYRPRTDLDIVIFPTFLDMKTSVAGGLRTGGQCGYPEQTGAHTGDISMAMLKNIGCTHVLCVHSERRSQHGESNEDVAAQVKAASDAGLLPVACVGETLEQRQDGQEETIVRAQVRALPLDRDLIIAYEPVWAISGGDPKKQAITADDAQKMHAFIRSLLPRSATTRIIYGGSMKPPNARDLLEQPDIDGGLVGGASLNPQAFGEIVKIAAAIGKRH